MLTLIITIWTLIYHTYNFFNFKMETIPATQQITLDNVTNHLLIVSNKYTKECLILITTNCINNTHGIAEVWHLQIHYQIHHVGSMYNSARFSTTHNSSINQKLFKQPQNNSKLPSFQNNNTTILDQSKWTLKKLWTFRNYNI